MGGKQFPRHHAGGQRPKRGPTMVHMPPRYNPKRKPDKLKSPPSTPPLPWYEGTLLWGSLGAAIAIILTVVAAMSKDLRWLLILAWPFSCLAVWAVLKVIPQRGLRWPLIIASSLLIAGGLYWVNVALRPPHAEPAQISPLVPSVNVDAYIQPGSSNPYPPQTILGGIVWNDNYIDVRLDIGLGATALRNVDFSVSLDTSIAGIGQISQFPGVTSFPNGREMPAVSLEGTDDKGKPITVPVVPTQGLAQIAPRYRVHCNALYSNTVLHLIIASVAVNQATQGMLPERLFAPKRTPHVIKVKGTFEANSQTFPIEFDKTLENPESEQAPSLPAGGVHKPKPNTPVPQTSSENINTPV